MYDANENYNNIEIEEALEFIYDSMENENCVKKDMIEQKFPGISDKLEKYNLIEYNDDVVRFTEEGYIQGKEVIRHHRLAERLLVDILQIEDNILEEQACKFEHLIKKEVEQKICALLGHPKVCPHNKKIPPGECCKKKLDVKRVISSLIEMKVGDTGEIAYLNTLKIRILKKLLALGIHPGEPIEVIKTTPSYAVKVGMSQFVFDAEVASNIFVQLSD